MFSNTREQQQIMQSLAWIGDEQRQTAAFARTIENLLISRLRDRLETGQYREMTRQGVVQLLASLEYNPVAESASLGAA